MLELLDFWAISSHISLSSTTVVRWMRICRPLWGICNASVKATYTKAKPPLRPTFVLNDTTCLFLRLLHKYSFPTTGVVHGARADFAFLLCCSLKPLARTRRWRTLLPRRTWRGNFLASQLGNISESLPNFRAVSDSVQVLIFLQQVAAKQTARKPPDFSWLCSTAFCSAPWNV